MNYTTTIVAVIAFVILAWLSVSFNALVRRARTWWAETVEEARWLIQVARVDGLAGLDAALRLQKASRRLERLFGYVEKERAANKQQLNWLEAEITHARKSYTEALEARNLTIRDRSAA